MLTTFLLLYFYSHSTSVHSLSINLRKVKLFHALIQIAYTTYILLLGPHNKKKSIINFEFALDIAIDYILKQSQRSARTCTQLLV